MKRNRPFKAQIQTCILLIEFHPKNEVSSTNYINRDIYTYTLGLRNPIQLIFTIPSIHISEYVKKKCNKKAWERKK